MTLAAMIAKAAKATKADPKVVEAIAQSLWQDDGSGVYYTSDHVRRLKEYVGRMGK